MALHKIKHMILQNKMHDFLSRNYEVNFTLYTENANKFLKNKQNRGLHSKMIVHTLV